MSIPATITPTFNLDMHPDQATLELCPVLAMMVEATAAGLLFDEFEAAAKGRKKRFRLMGLGSLVCLTLLLTIIVVRLVLSALGIPFSDWVSVGGALVGLAGLALTIINAFQRNKEEWLSNRYKAERVRQWKFQQFLDGNLLQRVTDTNKASTDSINNVHVRKDYENLFHTFISKTFQSRSAGRKQFRQGESSLREKPEPFPNAPILLQLQQVYGRLRIEWQKEHFEDTTSELETLDKWTEGLAQSSLIAAALLTIVEFALATVGHFRHVESTFLVWLVAGLSVEAAVISAVVRAVRHGLGLEEEVERYMLKAKRLGILQERFAAEKSPERVVGLMAQIEDLLEDELREFVNTFERADFLL